MLVPHVRLHAIALPALAFALAWAPSPSSAQSMQQSMKSACPDAAHAFSLRQAGLEATVVADPAATPKLRQAALLFYRCSEREHDPYLHDMFVAYYANTLYKIALGTNDDHALALASAAAQEVDAGGHADARQLVADIGNTTPPAQEQTTPAPAPAQIPASYCSEYMPSVLSALQHLQSAVSSAQNAGQNDTEYLATTTARYGDAFKYVEDDYTAAQGELEAAHSSLNTSNTTASDFDGDVATRTQNIAHAIESAISYTETYSRLALLFERSVNGANRRLAAARVGQALSSTARNTSSTYTNGNANCYSFSTYSANCSVSSTSTTTYNNNASIAQENAANAVNAAEAGRLSINDAGNALTQGLSELGQIQDAIGLGITNGTKACQ